VARGQNYDFQHELGSEPIEGMKGYTLFKVDKISESLNRNPAIDLRKVKCKSPWRSQPEKSRSSG
jgi:hypothetical protein